MVCLRWISQIRFWYPIWLASIWVWPNMFQPKQLVWIRMLDDIGSWTWNGTMLAANVGLMPHLVLCDFLILMSKIKEFRLHIHIYIHIYIYTYIYIYIYIYTYIYIHTYIQYVYMRVYIYIYMYTPRAHVPVYVYVCIFKQIYTTDLSLIYVHSQMFQNLSWTLIKKERCCKEVMTMAIIQHGPWDTIVWFSQIKNG